MTSWPARPPPRPPRGGSGDTPNYALRPDPALGSISVPRLPDPSFARRKHGAGQGTPNRVTPRRREFHAYLSRYGYDRRAPAASVRRSSAPPSSPKASSAPQGFYGGAPGAAGIHRGAFRPPRRARLPATRFFFLSPPRRPQKRDAGFPYLGDEGLQEGGGAFAHAADGEAQAPAAPLHDAVIGTVFVQGLRQHGPDLNAGRPEGLERNAAYPPPPHRPPIPKTAQIPAPPGRCCSGPENKRPPGSWGG